jgi:hypothetical protein
LFENFFVWDLTPADPPKSPLKRGTLRNLAPLCKGDWGPHRGRFLILSVKAGPGRQGGIVDKEDFIQKWSVERRFL